VFEDFLSSLGDRINMKGWDKYRGDFSNKGTRQPHIHLPADAGRSFLTTHHTTPHTHTHHTAHTPDAQPTADQKSLYTVFGDHEIMYVASSSSRSTSGARESWIDVCVLTSDHVMMPTTR
jgi:hypothetical protein